MQLALEFLINVFVQLTLVSMDLLVPVLAANTTPLQAGHEITRPDVD